MVSGNLCNGVRITNSRSISSTTAACYRLKALTRNAVICPRVTVLFGQYIVGEQRAKGEPLAAVNPPPTAVSGAGTIKLEHV